MTAHGGMFGTQNVFHYSNTSTGVQNLFTKAGSPTFRGDFIFVVDPGVILGSSSIGSPTMRQPNNWVAGSTVKLIILGSLVSCGGNGGGGAGGVNSPGANGSRAGDVLDLRYPITIDVTNGFMSCGGSGGNGGAGAYAAFPPYPTTSGGDGGGGQGYRGGSGATDGSFAAPGAGGEADQTTQAPGDPGEGGNAWGFQSQGVYGLAYTIKLNGNPSNWITWIGKTSNNVKGPIA